MVRRYTAFGRLLEDTEPDLYACYVHFNDHQAVAAELSRCQARIGELEFQVQHWKERATMQEAFHCAHCGGTGGHWEGCKAPVVPTT